MEKALRNSMGDNVYTLEKKSAWITANGFAVWIIKTENGLSVVVWPPGGEEPIDAIVAEGKRK
jgi:hypothetical protein